MKKILLTSLFYTLVVCCYSQGKGIPNPASLYARFLGYKSEVRVDSTGNQLKVCVFPDGSECDEWAFFRGLCGKEFSYCALKGCQTETETTPTSQFAVCVCTDSLGNKVRISLNDFMNQNGDSLFK
jgi:putative hemolysin